MANHKQRAVFTVLVLLLAGALALGGVRSAAPLSAIPCGRRLQGGVALVGARRQLPGDHGLDLPPAGASAASLLGHAR